MADVEIRLGAQVLHLRPAFGAMREIEAKTQSSCATLLNLLARHELHASEMALIIFHGLQEAGEAATDPESVGNQIFKKGIGSPEIRNPVAAYLSELLYAPDSARKKAVGEWFAEIDEITSQMFSSPRAPSDGSLETYGEALPENSGRSSKRRTKNPKG